MKNDARRKNCLIRCEFMYIEDVTNWPKSEVYFL